MKRTALNLLATLICVAALAAGALALTPEALMKAEIPFAFSLGEQELPAGTYTLSRANAQGLMILRNEDLAKNVAFITRTISPKAVSEHATLEFHRYGDQYFLTRVQPEGTATGYETLTSRRERAAAEGAKNLAGKPVKPEIVRIAKK